MALNSYQLFVDTSLCSHLIDTHEYKTAMYKICLSGKNTGYGLPCTEGSESRLPEPDGLQKAVRNAEKVSGNGRSMPFSDRISGLEDL